MKKLFFVLLLVILACAATSIVWADAASELKRGKELFGTGSFDQAIACFNKILINYPSSTPATEANYWLGFCYEGKNDTDQALKYFIKHITDFPSHYKNTRAISEIAQIYQSRKDYDNVITWFNKMLSSYPDHATEAYLGIASCYRDQGKYNEAVAAYKAGIAASPNTPKDELKGLKYDLGGYYRERNDWNNGIELYKSLIQEYPEDARDNKFNLAECYMAKKDYDNAMAVYEDITRSHPGTALAAYRSIGAYYREQRKQKEAINVYKEGIASAPLSVPDDDYDLRCIRIELAECYKEANDWDNAIAVYQNLINKYPEEAESFKLEIAGCYSSEKDYDTAIALYRELTTGSPTTAMIAWFYTGWCYQCQEKFTDAITAYKAVMISAPEGTAKDDYYTQYARVHLAECHRDSGDWDGSRDYYLAVAADCPENAGNYKLDSAEQYRNEKDYDKTISICEDIAIRYPEVKIRAMIMIAECLLDQRKDIEAQQKFDEVIARLQTICNENPGSEEAIDAELRIARIELHELHHCDKARMLLQNFMANHPDYEPMITVAYDLAESSYWRGRWSEAITLFEEARKCKDYSNYQAMILYMIADSYMRLRDHQKAQEYANLLLSTYPTDCWATLAASEYVNLISSETEYGETE